MVIGFFCPAYCALYALFFEKADLEVRKRAKIDPGPQQGNLRPKKAHLRFKRKDFRLNSRKSVRWSAVPVPCLSGLWLKLRGEQGSGPEGVDDLCFHTYGEFSPPPPSGIGPFSWDLDLEAEIWVSGLGFEGGGRRRRRRRRRRKSPICAKA